MAKQAAADKRRFVNRNPRLAATAKIVDILSGFDPVEQAAILRAVQDLMREQPELAFVPSDQQ